MATILIVDDLSANRQVLVTLLTRAGHHVMQAEDGSAALAVCRSQPVDLVITDVLMPVMDGFQLVRELRRDSATAAIPVVFNTIHYGEPDSRALAMASGVRWVIPKPAKHDHVLEIVDSVLASQVRSAVPAGTAPAPTDLAREHLRLLTDKLADTVDELRTTNARWRTVISLGLELAAEHDVDRLIRSVCVAAHELFGTTYVTCGLVDMRDQTVQRFASYGTGAATWIATGDAVPGILRTVVAERRTVRGDNAGGDPASLELPVLHPAVHAYLATHIASATTVYGWLCLVGTQGRSFTPDDEEIAIALAGQVGRAIESGHLRVQPRVERLSNRRLET